MMRWPWTKQRDPFGLVYHARDLESVYQHPQHEPAFTDQMHPTGRNGVCPECYSKGYDDALEHGFDERPLDGNQIPTSDATAQRCKEVSPGVYDHRDLYVGTEIGWDSKRAYFPLSVTLTCPGCNKEESYSLTPLTASATEGPGDVPDEVCPWCGCLKRDHTPYGWNDCALAWANDHPDAFLSTGPGDAPERQSFGCYRCGKPSVTVLNINASAASSVPSHFEPVCAEHGGQPYAPLPISPPAPQQTRVEEEWQVVRCRDGIHRNEWGFMRPDGQILYLSMGFGIDQEVLDDWLRYLNSQSRPACEHSGTWSDLVWSDRRIVRRCMTCDTVILLPQPEGGE